MELNSIIILYSLLSTLFFYPLRSAHNLTLGANYFTHYTLLSTLFFILYALLITLHSVQTTLLFTLYPLLSPSPSPPNMVYKCRTKGIVGARKTLYLCTQKKYQR